MRTWSLRILLQVFRLALSALHWLTVAMVTTFKSRTALQVKNALRHQLAVLRRSVKRPKLRSADRLLRAWLCEAWSDCRSSLLIVKPQTVIGWHRKGFRLFWTWKVHHGQSGRPSVSKEIRQLIRQMSHENPLWGAPRIHGELLKLGIDISETSVGKYLAYLEKSCRIFSSLNWRPPEDAGERYDRTRQRRSRRSNCGANHREIPQNSGSNLLMAASVAI